MEQRAAGDDGVDGRPSSPMSVLQKAYNDLYAKYQSEKSKKIVQVEMLLEDQRRKKTAYCKAADALVDAVRKDNLWLQHQLEEAQTLTRLKELEKENALYRNQLLMARAQDEERYRFMQKLLQPSELRVLDDEDRNSTRIVFLHQASGLKFQLEPVSDTDIARLCGASGEVRFSVISLGTLSRVAPDWIRESMTFSISQAPAFFQRVRRVASGKRPSDD